MLEASAKKKYNENTISINGNIEDAAIEVEIAKDGQSFEIKDSYNIHSDYEKRAILETILNSEYYTSDYKDIDAMVIEWSGHNFAYRVTKIPVINEFVSKKFGFDNANEHARNVNIDGLDPYQSLYEDFTLGGLIPW